MHVVTQKGRGYAPAENDPIKHLHDIGQPKPGTYTAAFTEAMIKEAEARPELVAITAAMPDSTGLLPFGERFPGRLIDVGIAEQHAVTSAAGMAMGGLRPVVAVYSTFLTRAIDQVTYDVGLHGLPVVFCLDRAGITGDDGPSHHGVLDMALLTKVPGMTLFAPSSYQELGVMLHDALELCERPGRHPLVEDRGPVGRPRRGGLGPARPARSAQGRDLCILAVGKMLAAATEAADALAADGIEATVWDVRVVPLDPRCSPTPPSTRSCSPPRTASATAAWARSSPTPSPGARRRQATPPAGAGARHARSPTSPTASADAILAELGLDAAGLAGAKPARLRRRPPRPRPSDCLRRRRGSRRRRGRWCR